MAKGLAAEGLLEPFPPTKHRYLVTALGKSLLADRRALKKAMGERGR